MAEGAVSSVTTPVAVPAARPARERGAGGRSATKNKRRNSRRETVAGYGFLLPWLLGFLGLTLGPMLFSLYLAFTRYNLFTSPRWIGFDNFTRLADDPVYKNSVKVTLQYVLLGTPIKLAASLAVAMMLNSMTRGSGFFRSAFYAPSLIGASVSVAIVWRAMFSTRGPVDAGFNLLGINLGGWVGNPDLVPAMMIALAVWQFGAPMVIFLAGLKQIPQELYEAAEMDGANKLRKFASVTLPMLSPVIFFNLLLETIHAFQIFSSAFIISQGSGGPGGTTNFYTVYLYKRAFADGQLGYASAMAWVLVIAVAIAAFIMFRTSKGWVHYGGDR